MNQGGPERVRRMSGKEKVLAVLMEAVEARQVFREWPGDMNLAVCLMPSGDCQLMVYRQEEAEVFPLRLQRHLNLDAAEMCVFPPVPGFGTRSMLYSDERRLLALVAESPEIVEDAADYSVNYAYALEEGLDPAAFLGVETGPRRPAAEFVSRRSAAAASEAPVAARNPVRRVGIVPGFMRRETAALPGPRFRSVCDIEQVEQVPALCEIHAEKAGWILIEGARRGGSEIRISNPENIFLRDDRSVVAVRLEPPWPETAGLPARVWIQARPLPESVRTVFAESAGAGRLTINGSFLYLNLESKTRAAARTGARPEPETRPEPTAEPTSAQPAVAKGDAPEPAIAKPAVTEPAPPQPVAPPRARRGLFSGLRRRGRRRILAMTGVASVLVLIGLGLQLGGYPVVTAGDADTTIDWNQFRITWRSADAG